MPVDTPTAYHVKSLVYLGNEAWYINGVVLQVGVHEHEDISARVGYAGSESGSLPEIAPELDYHRVGIRCSNLAQAREAGVAAAIVNVHHLIRGAQPLHGGSDA